MIRTVQIVDDDTSFRTALKRRLEKVGYQVQTYATAQELLDRWPGEKGPCCILLDVRMPGLSGPELQRRLNELGSSAPIIFVSGYPDVSTAVRALRAGADNVLMKPIKTDELLSAIDKALAQHSRLLELNAAQDVLRTRLATLTLRERQVFELVVRGNINKQIAHQLGTSERTIKAHRHRVMEKMLAQSVPELVLIAVRLSYAPDGPHEVDVEMPQQAVSGWGVEASGNGQEPKSRHGAPNVEEFTARANIDHYLTILDDPHFPPERHATIIKLLVLELDRLGGDQEQLAFAESRAANARGRLNGLRQKLNGATDVTHRATVEKVVANFEVRQKLLDDFCHYLRTKVNSRF